MKIVVSALMLFCIIFPQTLQAQELIVKGMRLDAGDLSANTYERKDLNGTICALVKVQLDTDGAQFEGNVIGDVVNKTGEYWVYMTEGSKELRIKHPNYLPLHVQFSDYGIERSVKSKMTYVLMMEPIHTATMQQMKDTEIEGKTPHQIWSLGYDYQSGRNGKVRDYAKALKYFRIAATQGNNTAGFVSLGDMYYHGYGTDKNYKEALKWYHLAAEQQDFLAYQAQYNLGEMYQYGQGVEMDLKMAKYWYQRAEEGYPGARKKLKELKKHGVY